MTKKLKAKKPLNSIPKGWAEATLAEISHKPQYGWTTSSSPKGEIKLLRTTDISNGILNWETVPFCNRNPDDILKYQIKQHDIFISRAGSVGISYMIDEPIDFKAVFASYLIRIRIVPPINYKYIGYFFQSEQYWNQVTDFTSGIAIPNINSSKLQGLKIPVAPLELQKEIVNKLDEMFAKVQSGFETLNKLPDLIKRVRLKIIASATSGELTIEWRKHNLKVEPAKELITKINESSTYLKNKKLDSLINTNNLKIPDTWVWTKLTNISQIAGGVTKGRKFKDKKTIKVPYLRVANVQDGYLDLTKIKKIEVLPSDRSKYKLLSGDILFTEGGDRDKLGRNVLWKDEIKNCIHQNHIFRARVNKELIVPEYISLFTKSELARNYFFENASQTVNLASINLTTLGNVPIALPPYEEQKEIVKKVNEVFQKLQEIEKKQKIADAKLVEGKKLFLSLAFSGELIEFKTTKQSVNILLQEIKKSKDVFLKSVEFKKSKKIEMPQKKEKVSLYVFIKKNFKKRKFTYSQLTEKYNMPYSNTKEDLFALLEKELSMEFDKKLQTMFFKLK